MSKMGRPTKYTEELAQEICDAIASSTKGVPRLCEENVNWPHERNIYKWFKNHPDFRHKYLEAKKIQAALQVEEIDCLVNDESKDFFMGANGPQVNTARIARLKMMIQNRQWNAARLLPKQYGDKLEVHSKQEMSKETIENLREARKEFKKDC
jgi:hypothetical protein